MGIFTDAFSAKPGQQAAADQIAALENAKGDITSAYGSGRQDLSTNYAKGLQEWDPVYNTANRGEAAYADMMGLNGPEGNARALAAFRNDPGYQFRLKQGLGAANAAAAKSGNLMSGGQMIDLNNYAQGVADQGWGNYAQRLSPFLGQATTAAGARSGIDTGLGNQLNANWMGQGTNLAGLDTAEGKARAGGDLAGYDASKNAWGAGLALANDAATFFGGGGPGKVKDLFSSFGAK
jgi:hypothetical protein